MSRTSRKASRKAPLLFTTNVDQGNAPLAVGQAVVTPTRARPPMQPPTRTATSTPGRSLGQARPLGSAVGPVRAGGAVRATRPR